MVQQEMTLRGHRTIAVDLPGRGAGFSQAYHDQDLETFASEPSSLAGVTAEETIGHVIDVVRRVREHGPVILAGHSFGGLVITAVANAVPELLAHVVYIAAQCPVNSAAAEYPAGPSWASSDFLPAALAITVGNPVDLGFIRLNWRGADAATLERLRKAVCAELTPQQYLAFIGYSQPDEIFWQTDPAWDHRADKATWGQVPHTFVRTTQDRAMPPEAQDLYIAEADALTPTNPFRVHSIPSSHTGFFRQPAALVDILGGLG
ncbi:Pimeloyl-ACP methyl ester carboxylesterase [Amycolatopsis xylanica]|uniref:Pimeloyl-ACP methyl ester carboxylesterase n=2 Tax=Amycolatopsis xylanica TaxID=589385 RepID=A0A1H2S701_9PSEU|nr:Pimeloyl-ACP methyl ester carboxylesterase [Amycolatopsis xylanica]